MRLRHRALCALAAASALAAPAAADKIAIHAGALIAEPGKPVAREQTILVEDGQIAAITPGYAAPEGAKIVDLKAMWVMPGLIDSHVHLTSELGPKSRLETVENSDADWALKGAGFAKKTLLAGFTTVQDVGGRGEDAIFALRDAIARGDVAGPRIRAAGQTVSVSGGHGDPRNGYAEDVAHALLRGSLCNGPDDCRRAVREQIRKGADLIKITATGGVLSNTATGTEKQFTDAEMAAIVEAARAMGRYVTAHAHGKAGVDAALRAGVHSIEHGTYLDAESIELFKETGAYLIPTVLAGVTVAEYAELPDSFLTAPQKAKSREVGPRMMAMLSRARAGGVKIAFGTDSGVSRHGDNARELELMVQAGFTPAEALRSATIVAAEHLELAAEIGSLLPGKAADIIAVNEDPLASIAALRDVDFVMKAGVIHKAP